MRGILSNKNSPGYNRGSGIVRPRFTGDCKIFKFIHAADIHLDSPLIGLDEYEGAPVSQLRRAPRQALQNLTSLAIEEQVDFVLIAGDLYDGDWKHPNTGLFFVGQMARLRAAGIPVFVIAGNHDAANKMTSSLVLPEGVKVLSHTHPETAVIEKLNVAIHGQSFPRPDVEDDISAHYPAARPGCFNIGLLHTSANGRVDHDRYAPCSVSDLIDKGYDYWALGHVHTREILCEKPYIAFSGNIQGRHIRESGEKGCFLVAVTPNAEVNVEFRPLDVIRWQRLELDCTRLSNLDQILDEIGDLLQDLFQRHQKMPLAIRVELQGAFTCDRELRAHREDWLNQIRSVALDVGLGQIWIEKLVVKTQPLTHTDPLDDSSLGELRRMFESLKANPQQLSDYDFSLDTAIRKFPLELRDQIQKNANLKELIAEAEAVLFQRLVSRIDDSGAMLQIDHSSKRGSSKKSTDRKNRHEIS